MAYDAVDELGYINEAAVVAVKAVPAMVVHDELIDEDAHEAETDVPAVAFIENEAVVAHDEDIEEDAHDADKDESENKEVREAVTVP
jgi:hypothetical protein